MFSSLIFVPNVELSFFTHFSGPEVMTSQPEVTTFRGRLCSFGHKNSSLKKVGSSNVFPVPEGNWGLYDIDDMMFSSLIFVPNVEVSSFTHFSGPEVMTSQPEVTTFRGRLCSFGHKNSLLKKVGSSNVFPVPEGNWGLYGIDDMMFSSLIFVPNVELSFFTHFSGPEVMTSQPEVTTFRGRLCSFGHKNSLWKKVGSSNVFPVPEGNWGLYYIDDMF